MVTWFQRVSRPPTSFYFEIRERKRSLRRTGGSLTSVWRLIGSAAVLLKAGGGAAVKERSVAGQLRAGHAGEGEELQPLRRLR